MARQEIILGTPPLGLGGDPPRTASMKINAMTTELYAATEGLVKVTSTNDNVPGRVMVTGYLGLGVGLSARSVSSLETPVDRNTGVSFDFLQGAGAPAGVSDGALMSLSHSNEYSFQMMGDWRTGDIWSNPKARAGEGQGRGWIRHYNSRNATLDPQYMGGLLFRTIVGNFAISKFANGLMIVNGSVTTPTAVLAADSWSEINFTLPVGFPDASFTSATINILEPATTHHYFGFTTAVMSTDTNLVTFFRNGPTAQTLNNMRICVLGHWK
ncbi:tail fiber protein (endogenous virus) [Pseudomonas phage phiAH14a]|uniref:Tail fiber protein n=1 Tax=Pseudomonas phage phiAH14a TaxID=1805958 RepID=A0A1B0VMK1_9CAUD|nr:tail fiber protein [Pseudomonas phage phiAH14a]AMW64550.1 tail fiber protein [Pseudomonas phage phiAH14a]